jgi:hypothetical protein
VNHVNLNSMIDVSEIQAAADALGQHLEAVTASTENERTAEAKKWGSIPTPGRPPACLSFARTCQCTRRDKIPAFEWVPAGG